MLFVFESSTLSLQLKMRHDDDDRVVGIPTVADTNLNICRQLTDYCHNHNSDRHGQKTVHTACHLNTCRQVNMETNADTVSADKQTTVRGASCHTEEK